MTLENPDIFHWILKDYDDLPATEKSRVDLGGDALLIAIAGRYLFSTNLFHYS